MSKFRVCFALENTVVAMMVVGKFPDRLRGAGQLFRSKTGLQIWSCYDPSLVGDYIFMPGEHSNYDHDIAHIVFPSPTVAKDYYNRVTKAIVEWSEAKNDKRK